MSKRVNITGWEKIAQGIKLVLSLIVDRMFITGSELMNLFVDRILMTGCILTDLFVDRIFINRSEHLTLTVFGDDDTTVCFPFNVLIGRTRFKLGTTKILKLTLYILSFYLFKPNALSDNFLFEAMN